MRKTPKARLYYPQPLNNRSEATLSDAPAHYLLNVLRMNCGDEVRLFDGSSGEYTARIEACGKKSCMLRILEKSADFRQSPDLWLLFAPVKKDKTDFIIAGATELGVRKIIPTITKRTISEKSKKNAMKLR